MSISTRALANTVAELTVPAKGILVADESTGTIEKQLKAVNVTSTEKARRDCRELLFSTPAPEAAPASASPPEPAMPKAAPVAPVIEPKPPAARTSWHCSCPRYVCIGYVDKLF